MYTIIFLSVSMRVNVFEKRVQPCSQLSLLTNLSETPVFANVIGGPPLKTHAHYSPVYTETVQRHMQSHKFCTRHMVKAMLGTW